ncbi:MAG TPA: hypothetical protein VLA56_06215 [Pseudomonadales bacterium]|nr:hypothetical protein [Pseudomonadales bacterium]
MKIDDWSAEAFNQVPDSRNEIHGDEIARRYGFKGGLVPGVTVSAYLVHPAVEAWGMAFLERGCAHVRVVSPLYDGERFTVAVRERAAHSYSAELHRPDGTLSATAEVSLPEAVGEAPRRRGDPLAAKDWQGPQATPERWARLQADGCRAIRYRWDARHPMSTYLRDGVGMPAPLAGARMHANMAFVLGTSNWILATNAHMNPWVHLETRSQNFRAIAVDTMLVAEMEVRDCFEKKGHEFVDVTVALYDEASDAAAASIDLRAIYRLRGL